MISLDIFNDVIRATLGSESFFPSSFGRTERTASASYIMGDRKVITQFEYGEHASVLLKKRRLESSDFLGEEPADWSDVGWSVAAVSRQLPTPQGLEDVRTELLIEMHEAVAAHPTFFRQVKEVKATTSLGGLNPWKITSSGRRAFEHFRPAPRTFLKGFGIAKDDLRMVFLNERVGVRATCRFEAREVALDFIRSAWLGVDQVHFGFALGFGRPLTHLLGEELPDVQSRPDARDWPGHEIASQLRLAHATRPEIFSGQGLPPVTFADISRKLQYAAKKQIGEAISAIQWGM